MWHVRPQGTEESHLTVMLAKFIAQIKTRKVTEQSFMVSSYPSGEILSVRRKADNGRPKGDVIGK